MKEYVTPKNVGRCEIEIKKSRFIAEAMHIDDEKEAENYILATQKKYTDASHVCWAYVCRTSAKSSDDGEPSGAAGKPILNCIQYNDLDRTAVTVVRYFGGIKLGAGGLVRAYSSASSTAVQNAGRVRMRDVSVLKITVPYKFADAVSRALANIVYVDETRYDEQVIFTVRTLYASKDVVTLLAADVSCGAAVIEETGRILCPFEKEREDG